MTHSGGFGCYVDNSPGIMLKSQEKFALILSFRLTSYLVSESMVCCGGFRQLLPMIEYGTSFKIENACLKKSYP